MIRKTAWRSDLVRYLASVANRPYKWGEHDSPLFVAGAIHAMTDVDPAEHLRGTYTTALGGLRALRKMGFTQPVDVVATRLEWRHPAMAHPGDAVLVEYEGQKALGVLQGEMVYVLRPEAMGMGLVPRHYAIDSYHVPFGAQEALA